MTTPDGNAPLDLTQTGAGAADAGAPNAPVRELRVHSKAWPLVGKMNLFSQAQLQKALNEGDLIGIVDGLARMVPAEHRDDVHDYLLADRDENDPEFVDDEVLLDSFRNAQEAYAARPTSK